MKNYARIQFYISGAFLILSLILFLVIYIYAVQTIRTRQIKLLELELDKAEMEVQLFFYDFETAIDDVENQVIHGDINQLTNYVTIKHQHHENISSIYFGSKDNVMYISSQFTPPPGFDLRTRIWYQMAVEKGDVIVTPVFMNATEDYLITTIAKPVYVNGELLGVIGIDVKINTIDVHIKSRVVGETGYVLLIDSNHKVLTSPAHWGMSEPLVDAQNVGINQENLEENKVLLNQKIHTDNVALILTDVVLDYYTLVVVMPNSEYYRTQYQFANLSVVVFVLINIVGIFFILFNRTFVIDPLRKLDRDIADIDIKNHKGFRIPYQSKDRFLDVKKTLNNTLDAAEEYFNESRIATNKLHLENQRFKLLIDSTQDFIIQINTELHIVSAYGRGLTKLQLNETDLIGKTMNEVFSKQSVTHDDNIDVALKGIHKLYDWEFTYDKQTFVYETSVSPIYDQNETIIGVVSISRDITETKKKQDEIKYINQHDYLTNLYNRRAFHEKLDEESDKKSYPMTIMMLDLNGLKIINDAFGHLKGDETLVKVSEVLNRHLSKHFVARIGGDEFAAIITNESKEDCEALAETIITDVSKLKIENVQLSISIGLETITEKVNDFNDVIKSAENNMYRHKVTESMSVRNNAIKAIHKTLTEKHKDERMHSEKVSQLCYVFGLALGLNVDSLKELKLAGMYHDIGKIAIPDAILNKPSKLTYEEFEVMKSHTELGYNILRAADGYSKLAEYALSHHERWDGKGYPRGLKGEEIPLFARMINLADSYDAMTSVRAYKAKMSKDDTVKEIIKHAGHQFDPQLARVFVEKVLKRPWVE